MSKKNLIPESVTFAFKNKRDLNAFTTFKHYCNQLGIPVNAGLRMAMMNFAQFDGYEQAKARFFGIDNFDTHDYDPAQYIGEQCETEE